MRTSVRSTVGTLRHLVGLRHRYGRASVLRDLDPWLRLQFLGVASRTGLARALAAAPGSVEALAGEAGLSEVELVESFLRLGVALGEVRERNRRFSVRGRRLAAVASGDADDLAGLVEELVVYDGLIYEHLDAHLRGAPRRDYLNGVGGVIARASRIAEHVVGPFLATLVDQHTPTTVLDVGCGTGVNLSWIASANQRVQLTGIDIDRDALHEAERNIRRWGLDQRCRLELANLAALPPDLQGPYDLVVLAGNIYYWPPDERAGVMAQARRCSAGSVVVITATPGRLPFGRHLDLALRVTERNWRLPTLHELRADATNAGFVHIDLHNLAPGTGMVALHAR